MDGSAVLWDLDGCLADTQVIHARVECALLARFGVDIDERTLSHRYAGVPVRVFFTELLAGTGADIDALIAEKWRTMFAELERSVPPVDGAVELVRALHGAGITQAVASGSQKAYVERVVELLGVADCFGAVVSSDEVARGKPAPDVFLLAAERIGAPPARCTVIEDGRAGMLAAHVAGMRCVGYVTDATAAYPANRLVTSFRGLRVEDFR